MTGHLDLTPPSLPPLRAALVALLKPYAAALTGVSCLAPGADALFADTVLTLGGRLVAVLPAADYRTTQVTPAYAADFDRLLHAAAEVLVMPYAHADRPAFRAANDELLRRADRLVAVWDGRPAPGLGGTADMVRAARAARCPVDVLWPTGTRRSSDG